MGIRDVLENAFSPHAKLQAYIRASLDDLHSRASLIQLAEMSDPKLIALFDKLEDYFSTHGKDDEIYKYAVDLKKSVDMVLRSRGYQQKTIYVKMDHRTENKGKRPTKQRPCKTKSHLRQWTIKRA